MKRVRTPTLLQMEATECGAAALGIILAYYGRILPLAELRIECGVSRDGSKASNILKAAKRYGMQAKGFKKGLEALAELPVPYIVFWNFDHFLVVEGFSQEIVYVNDPATGRRSVHIEEFQKAYTGVVLRMEPGPEFLKGGRQPSLILALADRIKGSVAAIIYSVVAGFLLVIPGLAIPVFSQVFVDHILVVGRSDWLRPLILGMILTGVLRVMLRWLQLRYLRQLNIKLSMGMSTRFLWHILRLPVDFYAQRFAGEISDRLYINNKVAQVLSGQLASTVIDVVMAVFYALVMLAYDWVLTAIGICFALVNIFTLQLVSRWRVDLNRRLVQDQGKVVGVSIGLIQSIETVKASALESDVFSKWSGYYAKAINNQQEMGSINQLLGILPVLLTALTNLLILIFGGLRVMDGQISIGMLVAFQSLMGSFQQPVNSLVGFASILQELHGDLSRLDDVLRNQIDPLLAPVPPDSPSATLRDHSATLRDHTREPVRLPSPQADPNGSRKLQGHVELRNVTFGYSPVSAPLIENFSCTIKPGQRVALVGASGSGKSTIAKLIAGLYQPWEGEIRFDGMERTQINRSILTTSVAFVEQDIFLFRGTVRDNLTLWDPTIPTGALVKAAKDAGIHEAIGAIPGGYDGKLLENGVNFSGGQRQRLEIARALANNPAILVLDEATSALDAETEKTIDLNLRRRGCTCIIVAHRLSTIMDCDEIIVLEAGKVVQRGTHEQMWPVDDGPYARLIRNRG